MGTIARRFVVRGGVQGVGYRYFAQRAAAKHQVHGYVRNEPDGSVEVIAEGPASNIEAFKYELTAGPQWATVERVEEIAVDPKGTYTAFRVER